MRRVGESRRGRGTVGTRRADTRVRAAHGAARYPSDSAQQLSDIGARIVHGAAGIHFLSVRKEWS